MRTRTNPFTYDDGLSIYERVKCVFPGFVIVPVRILLLLVLIALCCFFSALSTVFADLSKPLGPVRRAMQWPVGLLARCMLFVFGFHWIKVIGKPASARDCPVVVVAPHSSVVDAFYLVWRYNMPSVVSKIENRRIPFFGRLFVASQSILVDRQSRTAKDDAMRLINAKANNPEERHLMVFPEGTCTNRTALISFKRGAFLPGVPVQPVCLRYPFKHFDPAWTAGSKNRLKLVLRLLCQFNNSLSVEFLPPYIPTEAERGDSSLYASNVQSLMAERLSVPATAHSYEDMYLASEAAKRSLRGGAMMVEFVELKKLHHITLDDAKALLRRYAAAGHDTEGKMSAEQFSELLGLPLTEHVQNLFSILDATGTGDIDFTEFLTGVTMLSDRVDDEEGLRLIFSVLDKEKSGTITFPEAQSVLRSAFQKMTESQIDHLWSRADPSKSGLVDFAQLRAFMHTYPEYLHLALDIKHARDEAADGADDGVTEMRRLSVLELAEKPEMNQQAVV